jgi:hypothetical protein
VRLAICSGRDFFIARLTLKPRRRTADQKRWLPTYFVQLAVQGHSVYSVLITVIRTLGGSDGPK